MRISRRMLLPLAIAAFAASLAGCYTLLRHPDISGEYEMEDDQGPVVIAHCGECHAVTRPLPILYLPPEEGGGGGTEPLPLRHIDPATPVRAMGGGVGPTLPAATGTGGTSSDSKTDGEAKEASPETIKKNASGGKTPVKRDADDKSKSSGDEKKTSDTKKERS